MEYLFFLGGVIVGTIITRLLIDLRSCHGYFTLNPIDDPDLPEYYTVSVRLMQGQPLNKKKMIILTKEQTRR